MLFMQFPPYIHQHLLLHLKLHLPQFLLIVNLHLYHFQFLPGVRRLDTNTVMITPDINRRIIKVVTIIVVSSIVRKHG